MAWSVGGRRRLCYGKGWGVSRSDGYVAGVSTTPTAGKK